jgi:outer membrane biosynthesis protein TonB
MTLRNLLFVVTLIAVAAARADNAPAKPAGSAPPAVEAAARPAAASMVIEQADAPEVSPPAPAGEEKRAIGDYIRNNSADIQDCYAKRLQERPRLQGKLIARFDIGPTGRVIGATADGIPDHDLVLCVVTVVRKWEFEKPAAGGKLRIAYPWKFEAQPAR